MFTIGEFSKITGLTITTLRLYHEKGLLVPPDVNADSKYRAYDNASAERARIIIRLKEIGYSLAEIKDILDSCEDEAELLDSLLRHKAEIEQKIERDKRALQSIEEIIQREKEAEQKMKEANYEPEIEQIEDMLIAGIKMTGKYSDVGKAFGKLGKTLKMNIAGKAMNLYYDREYKEEDANYEACFPVSKPVSEGEIESRILKGGKAVTIIHKGPYENLGLSYQKLFEFIAKNNYEVIVPTREVYIKGPGMIFRGNPENYITEIQALVK
ncbi:MAG TPA: MerR family transcriptional regulator [Ignavibacteriales bacterium]|nr:MerR family transcriptional regulator [Ignavibacteriales bacterium]